VINAQGAISFKGDVVRAEQQRQRLTDEGVVFNARGTVALAPIRHRFDAEAVADALAEIA
jgi:alkylated DNA nucleotide flippase Atl1